jgi:hypothetical protein
LSREYDLNEADEADEADIVRVEPISFVRSTELLWCNNLPIITQHEFKTLFRCIVVLYLILQIEVLSFTYI